MSDEMFDWADGFDMESEIDELESSEEEFKPLPEGTYIVKSHQAEYGESSQKGTPYISITFLVADQYRTVDQDDGPPVKKPMRRTFRHYFYMSSIGALRMGFIPFCKAAGFAPEKQQEGESKEEMIHRWVDGATGHIIKAKVKHREDLDGNPWPEIDVRSRSHGMMPVDKPEKEEAEEFFARVEAQIEAEAEAEDIPF